MTKKSLNKLLSVILTLAICFTTVFGCFITANAADASIAEDCDHVFDVIGCTLVQEEPVDGYYVYKDVPCEKCGAVNEYQVVPSTEFKKVIYGFGEPDGSFMTDDDAHDGTEAKPYIISTASHLRYLVQNSNEDTNGKYFKVADDISAFVLQDKSFIDKIGGIKALKTKSAKELKEIFATDADVSTWQSVTNTGCIPFNGNIDFNGVTIYAMYNKEAGLFSAVSGNVSIKNLNMVGCVLDGGNNHAGMIVGTSQKFSDNSHQGSLIIEKCSVVNGYLANQKVSNSPGAIVGCTSNSIGRDTNEDGQHDKWDNGSAIIKNCFVSIDSDCLVLKSDTSVIGGVVSASDTNGLKITNCVVLGIKPFATWTGTNQSPHCAYAGNFTGCYTDQPATTENIVWDEVPNYTDKVYQLDKSSMQGISAKENMTKLDWNVWSYDVNGGYPTPVVTDKVPTTSQFNLNLLATNIDYKENGTFNFNFYYEDKYDIGAPTLFVGRADGTGLTKLSGTQVDSNDPVNYKIFEDAGINLEETEEVYKYTIDNISARELGETLLPTAVVTNGESTAYGKTEAISLSKYAKTVFDSNATDEEKNAAAALVNYGAAAKDALNAVKTEATKTVFWDGDSNAVTSVDDLIDNGETGTDWANAIIIDNAEELYYLTRCSTKAETTGKYFKVSDDIKNFVLQYSSSVDADKLMAMTDAEAIKDYLSGLETIRNWDGIKGSFNGNFDGNGARVYGLYSDSEPGLFGRIDCGVWDENRYYEQRNTKGVITARVYYDNIGTTIKNINVANSYFSSGWLMGGIVCSSYYTQSGDSAVAGVLNLEGCSVINCYFTGPETGNKLNALSKGVFIGSASGGDVYQVNNCITYGTKVNIPCTTDTGASNGTATVISVSGGGGDRFYEDSDHELLYNDTNGGIISPRFYNRVTNSIVLGAYPYGVNWSWAASYKASFSNVYTDQNINYHDGNGGKDLYKDVMWFNDAMTAYSGATAKETCPNLDWDNEWMIDINGGYPIPIQHEMTGKTLYWQGDAGSETSLTAVNDTGASGRDWDEAIIIDNAEELYWVLRQAGVDNTVGKYFKIADGIDRIVLQPKGVLDLDKLLACENGTAVQEYFDELKKDGKEFKSWALGGNSRAVFDGNIDGNGVVILGLYTESSAADDKVGFIGAWDGGKLGTTNEDGTTTTAKDGKGITVKNFTVGYSYMKSAQRLGVFGAQSYGNTYGADVQGVLNLDACAVVNCYLRGTSTWPIYTSGYMGVVTGECGADVVKMNNMLVYDNDATDRNGDALRLKGGVLNSLKVPDKNGVEQFVYNTVTNSLVLGADPFVRSTTVQYRINEKACFKNLYTDAEILKIDGNVFTDDNAKQIDPADLIGSKAQGIVDKLNGDNGTTWYIGNEFDGIPSLKPTSVLPTAMQKAYDSFKLTQYDNYGTSDLDFGVYTTNINLKNNPYMGITFALNGKYKWNRDKIDITISTVDANDAVLEIKDADAMRLPEYKPGEYISDPNGWTNKQNAGRYHLYTFKDLPVTDMCKALKITMSYRDDEGTKTVEAVISVEGYGCYKQDQYLATGSEYHAKCAEAARALVYYSQALKAKYGA